jgi:tetratricopeptide (TPR) repeat protein
MRALARLALALAVPGLGPAPAQALPYRPLAQRAQPAPGSPEAVRLAKKHFEAARKAYKAGSYEEAVTELNRAMAYDPKGKDLAYNLGLVQEKLGNIDAAIAAFERYKELETDIGELEKAIQTLRRLEGARDELEKKKREEEAARRREEGKPLVVVIPQSERPEPRPADKPGKGRLDGWVYATGGVAVVALGAGVYFAARALSLRKSADDRTTAGTSVADLQDRADRAHGSAVVADVCFGVAAVAAGSAALLYFTRDAKPRDGRPTAGASVVPGGGFVGVRGAF